MSAPFSDPSGRNKPMTVGPHGNWDLYFKSPREFAGYVFGAALTPKDLTGAMQCFWELCGRTIGKKYKLDKFPLSREDIVEKWQDGRTAIFIPREMNLPDLLKIFQNLESDFPQDGSRLSHKVDNFGWLWVEYSAVAPNRGASAAELEELFTRQGRQGQSLRTYLIGAIMRKFFFDKHFDEGVNVGLNYQHTSSILLGSCLDGGAILASFNGMAHSLRIRPAPAGCNPDVGGRSEEVVKIKAGLHLGLFKK